MIKTSAKTPKFLLASCILVLALALASATSQFAQAQSPTATESTSTTTTKSLKERIQKVVQENSDRIKGVIDDLSARKRGFVGQVQRLTEEAVTIRSVKGSEIIPIAQSSAESAVVILKNGREIKLDQVAVDDWVVVQGFMEDEAFSARYIQVLSESPRPDELTARLGTLEEITTRDVTVLPRNSQTSVTYSIDRTTEYQDLNGNEILASQIDESAQVFVVGFEEEDGKAAVIIRTLTTFEDE